MKKVNYAAIDIGSNAVRLLIKSVNEEGSPEGLLRKVQLIRIPPSGWARTLSPPEKYQKGKQKN